MKHKTSELTGALLDAAVAKAEGIGYRIEPREVWGDGSGITFVQDRPVCVLVNGTSFFKPSTDWDRGGPIIERERITVARDAGDDDWTATTRFWFQGGIDGPFASGPTALIAAMRAYAASKLGEEVDL